MAIIKSTISVRDTIETPSPIILANGNWGIWDFETGNFKDSGMPARGPQGVRGLQGVQGAKGDQGIRGPQGVQGEKGNDGRSSYTHIAYADNASGGGFSQNPTGKAYIGMYVDFNEQDSNDASKYAWSLIKGADGKQGIQGKTGADGRTPYLHIAYANSADGKQGFSVTDSLNKLYIGTYTDYSKDDSTDPTKYAWSKIKGDTGAKGEKGDQGDKGDSAIHVNITSQGEFLQRIITRDSQGGLLSTHRKEPLVVGGVKGSDGKNYLRLTAQVIKGGVDVTASALARGGGFTWLYKGSQIASGTATCDLSPAKYADGNEDQFELQLNTNRSNEW